MQGEVKYVNRGVEHFGTYRIEGRMLELTCRHGTRRAVIGLFEPKVLARKLLKFLVMRVDRAAPCPLPVEATVRSPRAPRTEPDQPRVSSLTGWSNIPPVRAATEAKRAETAGAATSPAA